MTLGIRKLMVLAIIIAIVLLANSVSIAEFLSNRGVEALARSTLGTYLTAPTITILLALMILLVPHAAARTLNGGSRCPVCSGQLSAYSNYCSNCGSRL